MDVSVTTEAQVTGAKGASGSVELEIDTNDLLPELMARLDQKEE